MHRVTRETRILAAPEAVFAALEDPAQRSKWLTSMAESPVEGAIRVGSRIPARRRAMGSTSSYELTVTVLEPPRRVEMAVRRNGAPAGGGGYELLPVDGGVTLVRAFAEFQLSGLQRLMAPMVAAGLERELGADLASLKRHVEASR